jgi:trehalose 6-phosphate synthase
MGRLFAVSNRTAAEPTARAGGLAVAVWDALAATGGSWVGWSGRIAEADPEIRRVDDEGIDFILVDLTAEEHAGFYLSFANRTLWPVFHYRADLAHFDDEAYRAYAEVNDRFARLIAPLLDRGDRVWIHDYHFLLLGEALRREGWRGPIGVFLHIPFPPPEIFRTIPHHQEIVRALCAADLVGVQTGRDAANLLRCLTEEGARLGGDGVVEIDGRRARIGDYPIGIDAASFRARRDSPEARAAAVKINRFLGGRAFVIGADRMDYSKGLPQRFDAVGKFFDVFEDMRGQVSVTQIAPPSRRTVEEYVELRRDLDRLAGRINGDYGDLDWLPLRYLVRSFSRDQLAGLFSIARAALVTPLRDGMNLVAKEYVMAQDEDDPGVLILSEFAGAAEQLKTALLVNPHDVGAVAAALHEALKMPIAERQARWRAMRDVVESCDVAWWRERFLADLDAAARCDA